jgi:hypothetical protein
LTTNLSQCKDTISNIYGFRVQSSFGEDQSAWRTRYDDTTLHPKQKMVPALPSNRNNLLKAIYNRYYRVLTMVYNTQRYWVFGPVIEVSSF